MHHDRLNPHYIRGFVKQCHDAGLTEEQTSTLLDEQLKYHLVETNEHYRAGIKAAMEKQANPLRRLLGLGAMAGGGALLGGAALNRAPEGARYLADNGVDLSFGVGDNAVNPHISGNALGGMLGTGLGLATMLRKGRIGSLKRGLPIARRILTNPATGKTTKGFGMDLAKPFRNPKDLAAVLGTGGAGGVAGYLAPSVNRGIEKMVDAGKGYTNMEWLRDTRGTEDPHQPWYAAAKGTGSGGDMSSQIPNLSLLPQEVRQKALGGDNAGQGGSASQNNVAGSPNWAIDQAGKRLQQIDAQLSQMQSAANDPQQSPMARERARQAVTAMTAQRDQAIAQARNAQKRMAADQAAIERKIVEERARAASRQKSLEAEDARLEQGPQRYKRKLSINPLSWLPFRGAMPTEAQHANEQQMIDDMILRNRERQWQLENRDQSQFISPESQQILTQYGI